jgi:hypothetical protein
MRRTATLLAAIAVVCEACQPLPDATLAAPTPGQPQPTWTAGAQPPAAPPACSSYTVPLTVGGQPQQAVVEACPQADGSWRITQTTPGLPPQVYEVPAAAPPPYSSGYSYPEAFAYPDFAPYWDWAGWGWAPWFFGLAPSVVVVQRFNHFHHGFAHGFGHGAHGFGHGMHGFGGNGFAGMHSGGMGGGRR